MFPTGIQFETAKLNSFNVKPYTDIIRIIITGNYLHQPGNILNESWANNVLHSWREVGYGITSDSGVDVLFPEAANPGRAGFSGSATEAPVDPAIEINNSPVPVGMVCWARLRGLVNGKLCWEFISPPLNPFQFCKVISIVGSEVGGEPTRCGPYPEDQCFPIYHLCELLVFDDPCDKFRLDPFPEELHPGDKTCAWVMELLGRELELDRIYEIAQLGGVNPALAAISMPVGTTPCHILPALYVVDVGNPARVGMVDFELGSACPDATDATAPNSIDLDLRTTKFTYWQGITAKAAGLNGGIGKPNCHWEPIDDPAIIADMNDCPLDPDINYMVFFHKMIKNKWLKQQFPNFATGFSDDGCTPLYLTQQPRPTGVKHIKCIHGILQSTTYISSGHCGDTVVENVGCCECSGDNNPTDTGGTGGQKCCDYALPDVLSAGVLGCGSVPLIKSGVYWVGSCDLSCGQTLYLRFSEVGIPGAICSVLEYSCDGTTHWVPTASAVDTHDTCGPPFVSRPFDGINLTAGPAGCPPLSPCDTINGVIVTG